MGQTAVQRNRHRDPVAVDQHTSAAGLRAIASVEAIKGIAVLLLGIILVFVHTHVEDFTQNVLFHLHVDTDETFGHAIMTAAAKLSDARLVTILAAASVYASVRFIEAWGLWYRRVWAEWFALLSGALYLPWEILRTVERVTWDRAGLLVVNVVIIVYMLFVRIRECGLFSRCDEEGAEHNIVPTETMK